MKGKVVIITGSSQGIGKTLAREVGKQGGKIVLNARNAEKLEIARQELSEEGFDVFALAGDVSSPENCRELVEAAVDYFGRVDVLINNAGISVDGYPLEDISPDVFRQIVEVNLLGSVYPTQAAIPHLKKAKGSVLFIGSAAGIHGLPRHAAYSASKMSLTALAESLRKELKVHQVHVGIAYVGFTENDPNKTILDDQGNIIRLKPRSPVKPEPTEVVARRLITMVERRQFKRVFTPLGKMNYYINRLFPGLVDYILYRNYQREERGENRE